MRSCSLLISAVCLGLGCGDSGTGPGRVPDTDGTRLASQFEHLADSVDAGGYSPTAEALRHAAEIVRLTGHATPVTVTIDGAPRPFLAVAEQIDFPNLMCRWPSDSGVTPPPDTVIVPPPDTVTVPPADSTGVVPPDRGGGGGMPPDSAVPPPPVEPPRPVEPPECFVEGTYSMRTLIAWVPEQMDEVVRLVAHIGNNGVATGVPDVMTELPTGAQNPPGTTPPDSGSGSGGEPGGWPGFMGEYLVRDVGSWMAFEGSQSNALEEIAGACTEPGATFDWAEFTCEAARLRFEFSMAVQPLNYERLTGVADPTGPEGNHSLSMPTSSVDGVRLTWEAWTPPPLPPEPGSGPDPVPVDSAVAR